MLRKKQTEKFYNWKDFFKLCQLPNRWVERYGLTGAVSGQSLILVARVHCWIDLFSLAATSLAFVLTSYMATEAFKNVMWPFADVFRKSETGLERNLSMLSAGEIRNDGNELKPDELWLGKTITESNFNKFTQLIQQYLYTKNKESPEIWREYRFERLHRQNLEQMESVMHPLYAAFSKRRVHYKLIGRQTPTSDNDFGPALAPEEMRVTTGGVYERWFYDGVELHHQANIIRERHLFLSSCQNLFTKSTKLTRLTCLAGGGAWACLWAPKSPVGNLNGQPADAARMRNSKYQFGILEINKKTPATYSRYKISTWYKKLSVETAYLSECLSGIVVSTSNSKVLESTQDASNRNAKEDEYHEDVGSDSDDEEQDEHGSPAAVE